VYAKNICRLTIANIGISIKKMNYLKCEDAKGKRIWHVCNPAALKNIIDTGCFQSTFKGEFGYDSGLNCYSSETKNCWNAEAGQGAILEMVWLGDVLEVDDKLRTPFPKDKLLVCHGWRSFIPIRSNPELCRITGFEFTEPSLLRSLFESEHKILSMYPVLNSIFMYVWKRCMYRKMMRSVNTNVSLKIE
jgi:hypothetical protein